MQLLVNVLNMEGHGGDRDIHLRRGRLIAVAFHQEAQQTRLLRAEIVGCGGGRAQCAEQLDHAPGDFGRHGRAAGDGFSQRLQELGW